MTYDNGVISLYVKGRPINFNAEELGNFLDISNEGLEFKMNKTLSLQGYDKKEFYYSIARLSEHEFFQNRKKIQGGRLPEKNSWFVGIFFIDDMLLHYTLGYVISPKYSNHSTMSDNEMQILYTIKNNIQVNWAYLILEHMDTYNQDTIELPYAFFVTKILEYFGVNVSNERRVTIGDNVIL